MARSVGIGEYQVEALGEGELCAYGLASCVGVALLDRENRLGALGHFLLPQSADNPERAREKPGQYCDTGVVAMLEAFFAAGARKRSTRVWLVGGASMRREDSFQVGKRNVLVARRLLWKNNLFVVAEETGGFENRNLTVNLEEGSVWIKNSTGTKRLSEEPRPVRVMEGAWD